ncbi:hypothetical protein HS088_TW04G01387 [Tripterygium wilfordii]|uniref:Uncharacterized protein n=1 Tax=Tripterygium wilfordii TaxID=458696 RepID=A0A7J7DSS9_TRIWF|nr:uncharacterized protein LOC119996990 [Tripterygium wilfordii]KAF5749418.1 hypothetical protein HS088_TW04G01387 [Tripterygium wilfordii]
MDVENNHKNRRERRQLSSLVLQGDDDDDYNLFFDRVISRDSSVGCSSRIYYCHRSTEGVPFQWEMQPGTPKDPPQQDYLIPPLSPPPAIINSGMPKPCIDRIEDRHKASFRSRFWLWLSKHKTKNRKIKTIHRNDSGSNVDHKNEARLDFCGGSSDGGESMGTPRNSRSSSSSSSSLSFSNGRSRHSSRLDSPARESVVGHYGCSPLNFNSVLVFVSRRV